MEKHFFVGFAVVDYAAALAWYERLLGGPPAFFASDTEAVWDVAEQRSIYIEQRPEHAGHAMFTLFVDDLDAWVAAIAERGLEPTRHEIHGEGVRKEVYCDPDGNEFGIGGMPQ